MVERKPTTVGALLLLLANHGLAQFDLGAAFDDAVERGLEDLPVGWSRVDARAMGSAWEFPKGTPERIQLHPILLKPENLVHLVDTFLHELAHSMEPQDGHHGHAWQARARRYGATPSSTGPIDTRRTVGHCKRCGDAVLGHRGLSRDRLYFHVRQGARCGMIIPVEKR